MSNPAAGKLADPAWRQERARKAANARTGTDYHVQAIVARAGKLTPEQIEVLRSLLPEPAGAGDQT